MKYLKDTQDGFEDASKGTLAETFIKANRPYMPENYEDLSTYSSNLKATYLDHVDFNNYLLQSSDFIIDRVLAFIFGMTADTTNEVYKKDIDTVIEKIGEGELELKTLLMQMVWGKFDTMGNTEMVLYVTDNYLLDLSKATNFQALTDELMVYKNNTIGKTAQNFDLEIDKNGTKELTSLYDLNTSEQYLIVFWSSSCGHCLDELPKLKTLLADRSEIKVIAIGLEDETEGWKQLIPEYPDFIHVLGSGKWENPIANAYGVSSTPSLILLDQDKKIIAKPYDVKALMEIIE
ncbi:MAG: TlpA family protein disulfide reductase [Psychroserpens sp.]|nr:TlpA family protein disulfide reductase [Psychroserpens sp.]